jgi:hypothetical protein
MSAFGEVIGHNKSAEKRPICDIAPSLLGAFKMVVRVAPTESPEKSSSEADMAKRSTARPSPEIKKLKAANLAYYEALSARDIRAMALVWTCAADNILIAPLKIRRNMLVGRQSSGIGNATGQRSRNSAFRCK